MPTRRQRALRCCLDQCTAARPRRTTVWLSLCRPYTPGQSMPLPQTPTPDSGLLLWLLRDSAHLDHNAPCIFSHLPAGICCSKDVLLRVLGNALSHVAHRCMGGCSTERLACVRRKRPRMLLDDLMTCADGMARYSCHHWWCTVSEVEAWPWCCQHWYRIHQLHWEGHRSSIAQCWSQTAGPSAKIWLTKPASLRRWQCHVVCLGQQTSSHQSSVAVNQFLVPVMPANQLLCNMQRSECLVQLRNGSI